MADEKERPAASERRYGKKEEPATRSRTEEKPAARAEEPKPAADDHAAARTEMHKRHEKEHRDLHGQHRDAMRAMHSRQESEMTAMNERQMGGGDGGEGGVAPQPAGPEAEQ